MYIFQVISQTGGSKVQNSGFNELKRQNSEHKRVRNCGQSNREEGATDREEKTLKSH